MKTETYLGPYSDCSHCNKDDPIPIAHTGDLLDYRTYIDNISITIILILFGSRTVLSRFFLAHS